MRLCVDRVRDLCAGSRRHDERVVSLDVRLEERTLQKARRLDGPDDGRAGLPDEGRSLSAPSRAAPFPYDQYPHLLTSQPVSDQAHTSESYCA
jgi:hypothetical protein